MSQLQEFDPSISVLMAVYRRDDPHHLAIALDSMAPFVSRLKSVVLVADGPLTSDLEKVVHSRTQKLKISLVRLPESVGLGHALNAGLRASNADFVLRMDADDVCRSERLDVLLDRLAKEPQLDVVGSYIAEFEVDPALPHAVRSVPLAHRDIERGMRFRSVMNHVSCLLRRQAVLDAGGYCGGNGFAEDWWLWARMLTGGSRFGNVDHVLVDVRVGNGFINRRRGLEMLGQDLKLFSMMRSIGFISRKQNSLLLVIKFIQRFVPKIFLKLIYMFLRDRPSKYLH